MNKRRTFASHSGIGALGAAAMLLAGCGGSSFQKNTFGNYANTLPAAYGIEPTAASPNLQGPNTLFLETSGLGSADSKTAYLTGALDFTALKNPDNSTLINNIDPNGTGKIPLGFSAGGSYIDAAAGTPAAVSAVQTGTSIVFRAALANGVSANNAPPISSNGVTLSSADPEWTLGTLPMIFPNDGITGPLVNATYATGTGTTVTPFTLPFTSSGIHTVIVTVADDAGRQTATTFGIPVVKPTDVALFLQSFTIAVAATATTKATTSTNPIMPDDTVTIDGGPGIGTYPAKFPATTADAQGTVVLFTPPGTHTVTESDSTGKVVQTATFAIPASAAGTTLFGVPVDNGSGGGGGTGSMAHPRLLRH